ncbi:hypothetical protein FOZ62_027213, partial [Perkinsus olseni]
SPQPRMDFDVEGEPAQSRGTPDLRRLSSHVDFGVNKRPSSLKNPPSDGDKQSKSERDQTAHLDRCGRQNEHLKNFYRRDAQRTHLGCELGYSQGRSRIPQVVDHSTIHVGARFYLSNGRVDQAHSTFNKSADIEIKFGMSAVIEAADNVLHVTCRIAWK